MYEYIYLIRYTNNDHDYCNNLFMTKYTIQVIEGISFHQVMDNFEKLILLECERISLLRISLFYSFLSEQSVK